MRPGPAALSLLTLLLAPGLLGPATTPAEAADPAPTLPLLAGDAPMDRALAWVREHVVDEDRGCAVAYGTCDAHMTKWTTLAVAHAGVDPATWPSPDASLLGWLLANADDLSEGHGAVTFHHIKSILALEAAGVDTHAVPLPDGGTRNLVAELLDLWNGVQFDDPGTTADEHYVNDDMFAVLALQAAGHQGPPLHSARNLIEASQRTNGGWASSGGIGAPSTDVTAAAIMALAGDPTRQHAVDAGLGWMLDRQATNGHGTGCFRFDDRVDPSAESTSWAIQALTAVRHDPLEAAPQGIDPLRCLLDQQGPDGAFHFADRPNRMATLQALAALSWAPYGSVTRVNSAVQGDELVRAGETLTLEPDPGFIRLGRDAVAEHDWTPDRPGQRTFEGVTWAPWPQRLTIEVTVRPAIPAAPTITTPTEDLHHGTDLVLGISSDANATEHRTRLWNGTILAGTEVPVRFDAPGTYKVRAWALNEEGDASPVTTRELVVTSRPPTLQLDAPTHAPRTGAVTLTATATDPDGDDVALEWWANGTRVATGPGFVLPPGEPGPTTLEVRALDPWGQAANLTHTLRWVNTPPTVAVEGPSSGAPGEHTFMANATDPDGDPVHLTWTLDGETLGENGTLTLDLLEGTHQVQLTATDAHRATSSIEHAMAVAPGALELTLTWTAEGLDVAAVDAEDLRWGSLALTNPATLEDVLPGQRLRLEGLVGDRVVATASVLVPDRPEADLIKAPSPATPQDTGPEAAAETRGPTDETLTPSATDEAVAPAISPDGRARATPWASLGPGLAVLALAAAGSRGTRRRLP